MAHLVINCGDHEEIERLDLDTGRRRRIVPSAPLRIIFSAETSADAKYLYTGTPWPAGVTADEAAWSAYLHERDSLFRIDLETADEAHKWEPAQRAAKRELYRAQVVGAEYDFLLGAVDDLSNQKIKWKVLPQRLADANKAFDVISEYFRVRATANEHERLLRSGYGTI